MSIGSANYSALQTELTLISAVFASSTASQFMFACVSINPFLIFLAKYKEIRCRSRLNLTATMNSCEMHSHLSLCGCTCKQCLCVPLHFSEWNTVHHTVQIKEVKLQLPIA